MQRYFMAAGTSFLAICLMFVCYLQGVLSMSAFQQSAALAMLAMLIFYSMFRSGYNLRFSDPNLAIPQMSVTTLVILYTMYVADSGRAVFVIMLLMAFLFSVLQLPSRTLLQCAGGILAGYAAVIGLLQHFKPHTLNLQLELLQWLALALTLPWFAMMGGFISGLRKQLRQSNTQLAGVLQRVQASESSLAQAQRMAGLGNWSIDLAQGSAVWSLETYRLLDIDPAEPALIGAPFLQRVHPEDRADYKALMALILSDSDTIITDVDTQFRITRPNGELRWVHVLGKPIRSDDGRATFLHGTIMDVTARIAQEEALTLAHDEASAARATLVDAIESLNDAFGLFDATDRLVLCNRKYVHNFTYFNRFEDVAGLQFEDLVRMSLTKGEMIETAFKGDTEAWVTERIRRHRAPVPEPSILQFTDGRWFQVNEQHTRGGGIVGIRRDISAQKQLEQRQAMEFAVTLLLAESETLNVAMPKIIQTMCETLGWDCGVCWHWDKTEQLFQRDDAWSIGLPEIAAFVSTGNQHRPTAEAQELIECVWTSGEPVWIENVVSKLMPFANAASSETSDVLRAAVAAKAGLRAAFGFPIKIGAESYGVMEFYVRDVRAQDNDLLSVARAIGLQIGQFIGRKAAEDEIWQLAFYDPLTRLPNRRLLVDRLQLVIARNSRHKEHSALFFIDLDNFKTINDTLGHDKGDLLLQQVAIRLSSCVRAADTVARQGGDEFVVMVNELSHDEEKAALQAESIGGKILNLLNQPYQLAEHVYRSTSSIGITLFDGRVVSTDDLLKRADLAMYQAKSAGRNTLRFFEPDMQAAVMARAELEIDLRRGQQDAQFILYYQAQVDRTGHWTGAEALIRWQHPKRGLVPPAEFISTAEETGLILPLGRWVMETACVQLAAWARRPEMSHLTLAVNVSMRQFRQPDFVKQITELLDATGADPRKLKLELTESMLLDDVEDIIIKMSALKALGVRFSLDDFGTGYSSLSYLKRLPLDQLKIDQTFIRDVLTDPNDAAIVRTIVALAQSLGLSVIAEGVETAPQIDFLANNGCDAYQGYLFSHPLPLEQFESLHLRDVHSINSGHSSAPTVH
ncbi:EAL domain-containing protein [Glaciimonas sp. PCH181]|uniref:EAL domain-containing protein n=1 Tax=Glaciimonas sp. PCH181 TaxID=2133943 RepID=UPI001374C184|nr:EAL domain-containing protein [Glaciimonas sp. PCH181]